MALVTVHRSPSPICDNQGADNQDASETACDGDGKSKSPLWNQSESYLAVKGAALILPQTEFSRARPCETIRRDIQVHLQLMLYLLRVQDKLKLAVKLESKNSPPPSSSSSSSSSVELGRSPPPAVIPGPANGHSRYMVLVSSEVQCSSSSSSSSFSSTFNSSTTTESDIVLGIDILDSRATVGLVLPVRGDCGLCLDGDGGFNVSTNDGRLHNFKPVSVQAMWSALQCLIKARDSAVRNGHAPQQAVDAWATFYSNQVRSGSSYLYEWHATVDSANRDEGLLSLGASAQRPADAQLERTIRTKLKEIMMTVDLEEVTSKYLRERLEEDLKTPLTTWRRFIDDEMIVIMRQMDAPSEIFPYLYLGSEWNASNLEELRNNKVGYILNVTREIANFYPETFEYQNVRIFDEADSDLLRHWENTHKFISKARDNKSKVLVHCKMGVSRSASTVIAFVMKEMNLSLQEAYKHVRSRRSCIQPNEGFRKQLEVYEGILDASRQRHSHLWQPTTTTTTSSSLDLRDAPSTPGQSAVAAARETPTRPEAASSSSSLSSPNPRSPSLSPSSSTVSCNGPRVRDNASDLHGAAGRSLNRSRIGNRTHSFSTSSSSDDASVFDPANSPLRPIPSISKSMLSVFVRPEDQPSTAGRLHPASAGHSRSRSASPKRSALVQRPSAKATGIAGAAGRRSWKRPESLAGRVKPDNFWIKGEEEEVVKEERGGEEEEEDDAGSGRRTGTRKALPADLTPGKVKRTKHEIETRERILSHSNAAIQLKPRPSGPNGPSLTLSVLSLAPQRASSFKTERSKLKESDGGGGGGGRKRRTYPLEGKDPGEDAPDPPRAEPAVDGRRSGSVADVRSEPVRSPMLHRTPAGTGKLSESKKIALRQSTLAALDVPEDDLGLKTRREVGREGGRPFDPSPKCKRSLSFRENEKGGCPTATGTTAAKDPPVRLGDAWVGSTLNPDGSASGSGCCAGRSKSVSSIRLQPVVRIMREGEDVAMQSPAAVLSVPHRGGEKFAGCAQRPRDLRASAPTASKSHCGFGGPEQEPAIERNSSPEARRGSLVLHRPGSGGSTPKSCSKPPGTPTFHADHSLLCN